MLIDWSKINFKQAQMNDNFRIADLDWDYINRLDSKSQGKIYKKINWMKVDYKNLGEQESDALDLSKVNFKQAVLSSSFALDAVDINETRSTEGVSNFNKLAKELKKSFSWTDSILGEASDQILQEIGYENFVGKISNKNRHYILLD